VPSPSTYAFKAVVGSFFDPDVGAFPFQGQQGVKQITITNATERTAHDTAADGTIMVSYVSGASGSCDIETQQTSALHQFLVNWANVKFTQSENMDAARFAGAAIKVIDTINGAIHTLTGCSPAKIPDKPYGPAGGFVTWRIMAANVVTQ
jgi:hypothetical protein